MICFLISTKCTNWHIPEMPKISKKVYTLWSSSVQTFKSVWQQIRRPSGPCHGFSEYQGYSLLSIRFHLKGHRQSPWSGPQGKQASALCLVYPTNIELRNRRKESKKMMQFRLISLLRERSCGVHVKHSEESEAGTRGVIRNHYPLGWCNGNRLIDTENYKLICLRSWL